MTAPASMHRSNSILWQRIACIYIVIEWLPSIKESFFQPGIKLICPRHNRFTIGIEGPQIVSGTSRTNDEDAFLPERGQCPPHVVVITSIPVCLNGELAHWDIRFWVHKHEGDPCPVIKPPFFIFFYRLEVGCHEQFLHPLCQLWSPRSRIFELKIRGKWIEYN